LVTEVSREHGVGLAVQHGVEVEDGISEVRYGLLLGRTFAPVGQEVAKENRHPFVGPIE
jgi:hypothetical protein